MTAALKPITCVACGAVEMRGTPAHLPAAFCTRCRRQHSIEQRVAIAYVLRAIRAGRLKPAASHGCVDCAKPATDYDHRDYTQPLQVVPVCRSCNIKRGPAFDSVYRPAALAA